MMARCHGNLEMPVRLDTAYLSSVDRDADTAIVVIEGVHVNCRLTILDGQRGK
jgi:hypothetical protein